jgi:hypothetical protein
MAFIPTAFDLEYDFQDAAKDIEFKRNLDPLDRCLERKDFERIIKNKELFYLAYCKAIFPHQNKEESDAFMVSIVGKSINVSGKDHIIKQTQDMIEDLRELFMEGLESKKTSFEILAVKRWRDYCFRKESPLIDLCFATNGCYDWCYDNFIKPALPTLAEFCSATYIEDKKNQLLRTNREDHAKIEEVSVIRIQWQEGSHFVYPIPPKSIPEQEDLSKAFYSLYQKQQCCDFSLSSKEGVLIHMHSSLLYINGGPVFQALLVDNMKENAAKMITFPEYSQNTVQAFVEFIYLGGKAFSEKMIASHNQNPINLAELFEFANTYQITILVDCCTNLMSLFATKEDLETLQDLATLYDNSHLKQLCEHLSIKENANVIKV